jgi:hypothetical protein
MFDAAATELYDLDPTSVDRALHLHAAFVRAAQAIETTSIQARTRADSSATASQTELEVENARTLRAIVRAAAAAYARRLREEGVTPERMLVLVKATTDVAGPGLAVRELTNDIVRWSIEAYFAD